MKSYTQQEIEQKYANLPKRLHALAFSADIDARLYQLGTEGGLDEDGCFAFIDLIQLILVGIRPRKDLANLLESSLGLPSIVAVKLAGATEQNIFAPVSSELDQIQEKPTTMNETLAIKPSTVDLRVPVPVVPEKNILDLSKNVPVVLPSSIKVVVDTKKISYDDAKVMWEKLPIDVQEMIQSADLRKDIELIMQSNGLHTDEAGDVETLISMVLLGAVHTRDFVTQLTATLPNQPKDKIFAVAEAVNKRVFTKMQGSLREIIEVKQAQAPAPKEVLPIPEVVPPMTPVTPVTPAPIPVHIPAPAPIPTPTPQLPVTPAAIKSPPPPTHVPDFSMPELKVPKTTSAPIQNVKMTEPTATPGITKDVSYINTDPKLKMIPADVKSRINSDPYKEPIE